MNSSIITNLKDEMDKLLERHSLPKLTQEEIDKRNRHVYIKYIESIFNKVKKQKAASPDRFTGEFYQTFKEANIPLLNNLFQVIESEVVPPNSYY